MVIQVYLLPCFLSLGVLCLCCHPSALLALGTLSSQLVLNLGWNSPFSGIPKRRILTRSFICSCTTQA